MLANCLLIITSFIGLNLELAAAVKECDAVVIGADTVTQDGLIANKVGSLAVALAAKRYNVPLMVVVDKSKGEGSNRIVDFEASNPEEVS